MKSQSPEGLLIVVSYCLMRLACSPSVWENANPLVRRIRWTARTLRIALIERKVEEKTGQDVSCFQKRVWTGRCEKNRYPLLELIHSRSIILQVVLLNLLDEGSFGERGRFRQWASRLHKQSLNLSDGTHLLNDMIRLWTIGSLPVLPAEARKKGVEKRRGRKRQIEAEKSKWYNRSNPLALEYSLSKKTYNRDDDDSKPEHRETIQSRHNTITDT